MKAKDVIPGNRVRLKTADGKTHEFVVAERRVSQPEANIQEVLWTTTDEDQFLAMGDEEVDVLGIVRSAQTDVATNAKARWDAACSVYHAAARELENAAEPYAAELVRKHYPTAVKLITMGRMNEDFVDVLRCERVILADGSVMTETTPEGDLDERFEAMTEDVEEILSWLIELDPDSYLNETEFDLGALVS